MKSTEKELARRIIMHGTNIQRHQLLQTLRQNISDEYNRINNITWDNIIAKIDTNNDPKTFFNAIKRMTGNASNIIITLHHTQRNKNIRPKTARTNFQRLLEKHVYIRRP